MMLILLRGTCAPPGNFRLAQNANRIILTWSPPQCAQYGNQVNYYSCDSTSEAGYAGMPSTSTWYGNSFYPGNNANGTKAILQEIDVWFQHFPDHGGDCLSIDVFNKNRELISTSDAFIPPDNGWKTIPVKSILVSDTFYVMLHWNNTAHETNRLGFDLDPVYGYYFYPWHYNGTTWQKITSSNSSNITFMIRAKGVSANNLKESEEPENKFSNSSENDGSVLAGYNVFRSGEAGAYPYTIINNGLIAELTFIDTLYGNHNYGY